MIDVNHGLI